MMKKSILFLCLLFLAGQQVWTQTIIDNTATGTSAVIPTGWSSTNGVTTNTIIQGSSPSGYYLVEKTASATDYLISNTYANLVGTSSVEISFDIAAFGNNTTATPLYVDMSLDNGGTWTATQISGTVTGSSPYVTQSVTFSGSITSSQVKFRFYDGVSGTPNVRVRNIVITAYTSCTAPTSQTTALSVSNTTNTSANFSWTAGSGDASLLALRATAQTNAVPASGTAYTASTDFSATTGINTNNKVVYIGAGNNVNGITNLTPGTQFTATAYSFNTTDNCYNTSSPATVSFYTFSTAPAAQPATFNAVAAAFDQVTLSFSAASTITNTAGYLILQKANAPMTGLPVNGTAYTVGATIGDATVAAIVTSTSATSQNITGLNALTTYFYTIVPFNWNGANAPTYNYNTTNAPTASATTPTGPSALSDIVNNAGGTFYTANINYTQYQATTIAAIGSGAVAVMELQLRDGGTSAPDADALPTQLTGLTINYTGAANTIRKAALFDGTTKIAEVTAGTNAISFTGLSGLTAADNGTKNFTLAVSFNTTVTDNDKLVFNVASASTSANTVSSQMAATNAGAASSDANTANDNNRIEVTATKIAFTTNASNTNLNVAMSPAPVVATLDANNNIDLDATGTVSVTSSGTLSSSPLTATLTNGQATFNNVTHTALGNGLVLTAQSGSFTAVNSASFNIHTIPYVNGDYRSTSDGNWPNTTGTWELMTNGTWAPATRPSGSYSAGRIYIQHTISSSGSFASPNISILENGKFTVNAASTIADLKVYSGGTFEAANSMTMSASASAKNVVVESGGKFVLNAATLTSNGTGSTIWNGNEDFQSGSILEIRNWNYGGSSGAQRLVYSSPQISPNANGYLFGNIYHYGAQTTTFGFLHGNSVTVKLCENNLVIESPAGSSVVTFSTTSANAEVGGSVIINSGIFSASIPASSANIHTIHGNLEVKNGATFRINQQNSAVNSTVLLGGDLLVQGTLEGTNTNTTVTSTIIFNKAGMQSIDIDGTLNNHVFFQVNSGAELVLPQNLDLTNARNGLEVLTGGVLNFNGFNVTGSGSLINNAGGILKITSPQGITASGATGNVQTTTRTYNAGGTYNYVGAASQSTGNGVPASVANVIVNNTNGVQLSQATTITGNLALVNGLISPTASNTLTLGTDATVTGGNNSSYINGQVTQATNSVTAKTLPVGKSGVYAPVVLTPAVNSAATFVAEYFNDAPANATTYASGSNIQSIDNFRYWDVNRTSGSAAVTINLPFQASSNIPDLSRAVVAHYNGSAWENAGNTATSGTTSNGTVTSGAVNTFSPFTVGVLSSTPLPVGLDHFNVSKEALFVNITWDNATEAAGSKYLVERSNNGVTFETIAIVNGTGKESKYAYPDRNFKAGDNYYRLTLVDINGATTVSKVKQVFVKAPAAFVEVYPNPASLEVKVAGVATGDVVNIYNANGALVQSVKATDKIVSVDLANLSGGMYQVQVSQSGKVIATEKLVIIK